MAIECMVWVLDLTGDINTNEKLSCWVLRIIQAQMGLVRGLQ